MGASPNPSFGVTHLLLYQAEGSDAAAREQVAIYDNAGRRVRTLPIQASSERELTITWDGRDHRGAEVISGVYYCNLGAGTSSGPAHRVIVVR